MILQPTLNKVGSLIDDFSDDDWVDEPLLHRASYEFAMTQGGVIVKEFMKNQKIKSSAKKIKNTINHGVAVGVATEGANIAYAQLASILSKLFNVSEDKLKNPFNKELITLTALAMSHLGVTIYDEISHADKITKGIEFALKGWDEGFRKKIRILAMMKAF